MFGKSGKQACSRRHSSASGSEPDEKEPKRVRYSTNGEGSSSSLSSSYPLPPDDNSKFSSVPSSGVESFGAVNRANKLRKCSATATLENGVVVFPEPPIIFPTVHHFQTLLQEREQLKSRLEEISNDILVLATSYKLQQIEKSQRMTKYAEINLPWGQLDEDIKINKLRFCVPEQSAAFFTNPPEPEPLRWQDVSSWEQDRIENYFQKRSKVSLSLVLSLFEEFVDVNCIIRNLEIAEPKDVKEQVKQFVQLMIEKLEVKNKNLSNLQSHLENSVESLKGRLPKEVVDENSAKGLKSGTSKEVVDEISTEGLKSGPSKEVVDENSATGLKSGHTEEVVDEISTEDLKSGPSNEFVDEISAEGLESGPPNEVLDVNSAKGLKSGRPKEVREENSTEGLKSGPPEGPEKSEEELKIEFQQTEVECKRALRLQLLEYQSLWIQKSRSFQHVAPKKPNNDDTFGKELKKLRKENQFLHEKAADLDERLKTAFLEVTTLDVKRMQCSTQEELIKSSVKGSQTFSTLDSNYQSMLLDIQYLLSTSRVCLEKERRAKIRVWKALTKAYNNPDPCLWNTWSARFTQLKADILGTKRQYQKVWLENEEAKIGTLKRESQIASFKLQLNVFEQIQKIRYSMKKRFTTFAILLSKQHQTLLTEHKVLKQNIQFLEKIQPNLKLGDEQLTDSTLNNEEPGSLLHENEAFQKRILLEKAITGKMRDEIMAYKALNKEQRSNDEIKESVAEYQRKIKGIKEEICANVKAELTDEAKEFKKYEELTDTFKKLTSTFQDNDTKINAITDDYNEVSEALEKLQDQVPNVTSLLDANEKDKIKLLKDHAKVSGEVVQNKEAIAVQQIEIATSKSYPDNYGISAQVPAFLEKLEDLSNTSLKLRLDLEKVKSECRLNEMEETDLKMKLESSESSLSSVQSIENHLKDKLEQQACTSQDFKSQVECLKSEIKFKEDLQKGGTSRNGALSKEIDELKASMTCPSCQVEKKNAYLGKCFHVSCLRCLNKRFEARDRKCPLCGSAFSKPDIHSLYIV